jgi:dipeptidyl aminopeptidase/acylaminoacyl peptidase
MTERRVLPYGAWPSPISIELAVSGSLSIREPRFDGDHLYWTEGRPAERGRQVVVRWHPTGGIEDVTPPDFNARTMVHEYGGGAYAVRDGVVYFANLADGRLYRQAAGEAAQPITGAGNLRYADLLVDATRNRLICVREDHGANVDGGDGRGTEPRNELVAISLADGGATVLVSGHDFYSTPRLDAAGSRLAWLAWRHPDMPWDGTELWLTDLGSDGAPGNARLVAGGRGESIVQPEWAPDGSLVFVSDRSGWWNLYRLAIGAGQSADPAPIMPAHAEFAGPQWVFGLSWYGIDADGTIFAIARRSGRNEMWRIPADGGQPDRLDLPETEMRDLQVDHGRVVFIGAAPTTAQAVILLEHAPEGRRVLRRTSELELDEGYVSVAQPIEFPTSGGRTAHALYYSPTNRDSAGPPDERPPLVVMSHGGPTSFAWGGLSLEVQLFTSRGFAVVDVDYGGSTGYGRDYMRQLDGQWGIVDVDDCVNAARYLAGRGDVDPDRMAITGGSAGGYTTLCALVFHDLFAAGASHYGVGDLEALARDTHKFESRYLDRLVAPYPAGVEVYRQRSPIHSTDRIRRPIIVLQGSDDMVVPFAQAETLVAALRQRRIPHAYLLFEGEGHGFREAVNIRRALEAELSFYAQVFGFELADRVEPVNVEFLERPAAASTG